MLIYQISLQGDAYDARSKTWDECVRETACYPDYDWRDPITGNSLMIAEFGCSISHLQVWKKIAQSGQAGLVLEEDAIFPEIDIAECETLIKEHDSLWLGWRENSLGYWYNAHAYVLSNETAKDVIKGFSEKIIPADEWLYLKLKDKKNYFFPEGYVKQILRSVRPSTIEGTKTLLDSTHKVHVATVATDMSKMQILQASANHYAVSLKNLGRFSDWNDSMNGTGGMPKIELVKEYLNNLPENDIFLFVDGYDTFFADDVNTIKDRFIDFKTDILFGAEAVLWPEPDSITISEKWPECETPYRYLNSGLYIGYVSALKKFFEGPVEDHWDDDQRFCQLQFLKFFDREDIKVKLDYEAYIFQNHETSVYLLEHQIYNPITKCCGCVYHGNGGPDAKSFYRNLAQDFKFYEPEVFFNSTLEYEEIAPNILLTEFLDEGYCKYLIELSESNGGWKPESYDKFPAQEIRLKELGLFKSFETAWAAKLGVIAEKNWTPMRHYGLRDAFTMKYTLDTQTNLGFHNDASHVTGSVKLNDDYEGALLEWPHQNFTNKDIKVGQCLLFPGQVTHGHLVQPLVSGTKYSLTMWTKRSDHDA